MKTTASSRRPAALLGVATLALASTAGCYSKVTHAEGFGADRITTEEGDRTNGPVEQVLFGDDAKKRQ